MKRRATERDLFIKQEPKSDFLRAPISRRGFLKTAGRMALTAALSDTIQGEIIWGGTNPEVHTVYDEEAERRFPNTYTLVLGGFNVANVKGLGEAVQAVLPGYGQVAYIQNADNGLHVGDIERRTKDFIKENNVRRLRLYGHSMGGMVAIDLASRLKGDTDLEAIILDCTPASYEDVRGGKRAGTWLLHASDEMMLHLGPNARTAMEAVSPMLDGDSDFLEACLHAMRKVSSPDDICSNKLVQGQASFIRTFDITDFKGAFDDSTHILRLRPEDYGADGTVDNATSLPRFEKGLDHTVIDLPVKHSGHADPAQHKEAYRDVLLSAAKKYDFYDGKLVPNVVGRLAIYRK